MWLCSVTVLIFYMSYWYLLIRLPSHCHKLWTSNESSHKNAWEFTVVPYEHHFLLFGFDLMDESVIKSELGRNRPLMRCKRWNIMKESRRCQKGGASGLRKRREARIPHLSVSLCKIKVPLTLPHKNLLLRYWTAVALQAFVGREGFNHLAYRCVWANLSLKDLTCFVEHLSFF